MKFVGLYIMLGAIALVVADFFTFGNTQVFESSEKIDQIGFVVFVVACLLFLIGLIKFLRDLFLGEWMKRRRERISIEVGEAKRASRTEQFIRVIILILVTLPVIVVNILAPIIGLLATLPNVFLAIYLLFNRKYHLVFNLLLLIAGIYLFFFSTNHFFQYYKMTELSLIPGFDKTVNLIPGFGDSSFLVKFLFGYVSVGGKFLFMLASLWLVIGDILAKIKNPIFRKWRGLVNLGTFLFLTALLLYLPYIYQPQVRLGQSSDGGTKGDGASHFEMNNTSAIMSFDNSTSKYVFTANLKNSTDQTGPIIRIVVDGKDFEISPDNKGLTVENGTVLNDYIGIGPSTSGVLKISSEIPFYCVTLMEKDFVYSNCFMN